MYTWIVEMGILVFIILVCFIMYRRMVPLKMPDLDDSTDDSMESVDIEEEEEVKVDNAKRFSIV
jgi:hypothetical protein